MNRYEPNRPRTAIALAAAALTAITIGILVVAPAKFDGSHQEARILAAKARPGAPLEVAISPAQINVVGVRQPELVSVQRERPVITPIATR